MHTILYYQFRPVFVSSLAQVSQAKWKLRHESELLGPVDVMPRQRLA
jgi:hypothetical protein